MQDGIDVCKKSFVDFLDRRCRQFPRYYFVSEADMLDARRPLQRLTALTKIMLHVSKIYLRTKTYELAKEIAASKRPVGAHFEPLVTLEGKPSCTLLVRFSSKTSMVCYADLNRVEWTVAEENKTTLFS